MESLFIGHAYIDVTMLADRVPTGDEKAVAQDYAVSFGGNAVTAGFACARLGHPVDLLTSVARDWLGHMFVDMAHAYGVRVHPRRVARSSLSFVFPKESRRAILRARDDAYLEPVPQLPIRNLRLLHLDGHMADAALHYARAARAAGALVSLDGGALRPGIEDLCRFIDVAVVSERFCEQLGVDERGMLDWLKAKGCRIGAVTMGARGIVWYDESGASRHTPALVAPRQKVIDTSGAGDVFHGAYCASFLERPDASWDTHFRFARAASAHKIQHLGNEAGLPTHDDVARAAAEFPEGESLPPRG